MTYGYTVETTKPDPLIGMIEQMAANATLAAVPLAHFVDILPALRHVPDGFPGAGFKETARKWREQFQATADTPYLFVRKQMATHSNQPSYVSKVVQECAKNKDGASDNPKLSSEDEEVIKLSATSMYGGGSETTSTTLTGFILAMVMFPDVLRKAQEEIDRVIGTDRLPQSSDQDRLPYIQCLVREAYRWVPALPMGLPHVMTEDVMYDGNLIPKGAIVIVSIWWLMHDPATYANPDDFNPDRYLAPQQRARSQARRLWVRTQNLPWPAFCRCYCILDNCTACCCV